EVPGGVDEGVHRLHLAMGRAAAAGTRGLDERLHLRERRLALAGEDRLGVDLRQEYRQLIVRDRDALPLRIALQAVDEGDGRAPVPLAAESPVLLAVGDGRLAEAALLEHPTHPVSSLGRGETGVLARVDENAVLGEGLGPSLDGPEIPPVCRADHLS